MKLKNLVMIAFAIFTVTLNTACPADIAKDMAEQDKLLKEYNDKVEEANNLMRDLRVTHGVNINRSGAFSASTMDWSAKSAGEKTTISQKLTHFLELDGRLIELSSHKNIKDHTTNIDVSDLKDRQETAKAYLDSLNKAQNKAS
jgi:hypothetical protein